MYTTELEQMKNDLAVQVEVKEITNTERSKEVEDIRIVVDNLKKIIDDKDGKFQDLEVRHSCIIQSKDELEASLGVCTDVNRKLVAELDFLKGNISRFKEDQRKLRQEEKVLVAKVEQLERHVENKLIIEAELNLTKADSMKELEIHESKLISIMKELRGKNETIDQISSMLDMSREEVKVLESYVLKQKEVELDMKKDIEDKEEEVISLKGDLDTETEMNRKLTVELDFVKENISTFQAEQIHSREGKGVLQDELRKKEETIALLHSVADTNLDVIKQFDSQVLMLKDAEMDLQLEVQASRAQVDILENKFMIEQEANGKLVTELEIKETHLRELNSDIENMRSTSSIAKETVAVKLMDLEKRNEELTNEINRKVVNEKVLENMVENKSTEAKRQEEKLEVRRRDEAELAQKLETAKNEFDELSRDHSYLQLRVGKLEDERQQQVSQEDAMKNHVLELKDASSKLTAELLSVRSSKEELETELRTKKIKLEELVKSMDQTLSENSTLVNDNEEKTENLKTLESDLLFAKLSLEKSCHQIENLKQELTKKCVDTNEQIRSSEVKITELERDVVNKVVDMKELTDKITSREKEVCQLNEQCNALRDNFNKLCIVKDESEAALKAKTDRLDTIEKENVEKENEIIEMGEKLQDVFSENDALKKRIAKADSTQDENLKELDSLKTCKEKLEEELREKEKFVSILDGKHSSMKSQLEAIEVNEKILKEQLEVSSQEKLNFEESLKLTNNELERRNTEVDKLVLDHKDDLDRLGKERKALEDEQLKLESEVAKLRTELLEVNAKYDECLSEEKSEVKKQFEVLQSNFNRQKKDLEFKINELGSSYEKANEELSKCKVEKLKLDSDLSKSKRELDTQIATFSAMSDAWKDEKVVNDAELLKLRRDFEKLQSESTASEEALENEKQTLLLKIQTTEVKLGAAVAEAKVSIDSLESEKVDQVKQIKDLKVQIEEITVENKGAMDKIKDENVKTVNYFENQKLQLQQELSDSLCNIKDLQNEKEQLCKEMEELKLHQTQLKGEMLEKVDVLEKTNCELSGELVRLKHEAEQKLAEAKEVLERERSEKVSIEGDLDKVSKELRELEMKMNLDKSKSKAKEETRQAVMDRLIAENERIVKTLAGKESQLSEYKAKLEKCQSEASDSNLSQVRLMEFKDVEIANMQKGLNECHQESFDLKSGNFKLNSEISNLLEKLKMLQSEKVESSTEINELKNKLEKFESEYKIKLTKSEDDLDKLKHEILKLREEGERKQILMTSHKTALEQLRSEKEIVEFKIEGMKIDNEGLSKVKTDFEKQVDALNSKLVKTNTAMEKSELHKDSLLTEIKTLQFQKDKCEKERTNIEAKQRDFEKMKVALDEMEDIKKKLQFSVSNAKRQEKEHESTEALLVASEEEKAALKTSSARLMKQLEMLRKDVDRFAREAEEASKTPWIDEEWEGLTTLELFNMMKGELVPAQQARLAAMAIEELEKELADSKKDFMKSVQQMQEIKDEKTKLEAKVCFLENVPVSPSKSMPPPKPDPVQGKAAKSVGPGRAKPQIAPAKLSRPTKKEIPGIRPFTPKSGKKSVSRLGKRAANKSALASESPNCSQASDSGCSSANSSSLRRSSRSASKMANISLSKTTQDSTVNMSTIVTSPPSSTTVTDKRKIPLPSVWEREGVLNDTSLMENSAFSSQQSAKKRRSSSISSQEGEVSDKKRRRSVSSSPAKTTRQTKSAASIIKPARLAAAPAQKELAVGVSKPAIAKLEDGPVEEAAAEDVADRGAGVAGSHSTRSLRSRAGNSKGGRKPEDCKQQ